MGGKFNSIFTSLLRRDVRRRNDWVLAMGEKYPGEVVPFVTVIEDDPRSPQMFASALNRGAKGLKLIGWHSAYVKKSRRAAAGRAELLAKKRHTDRLQNPAKLRRFWIRGGDKGRIIRDFRKMLHFGKIPKKFGQIWRKFSKILAKIAKFWKKTAKKISNF